jgi:hypothetical protein
LGIGAGVLGPLAQGSHHSRVLVDQFTGGFGLGVVDLGLVVADGGADQLGSPFLVSGSGGEFGDRGDDLAGDVAAGYDAVAATVSDELAGGFDDDVGQWGINEVGVAPLELVDAVVQAAAVPDPGAVSRVVEEGDLGVLGAVRAGSDAADLVEDVAVVGQAAELDAPVAGRQPLLGQEAKMRSGCWGTSNRPVMFMSMSCRSIGVKLPSSTPGIFTPSCRSR